MKCILAFAGLILAVCVSAAQAEVENCTEIAALPAVIATGGSYCFKKDLSTNVTSGNAITINAHNVIIEMNGYKLGGLAGGASTNANGIFAIDRQNIIIRNGSIRGFRFGILLDASGDGSTSSGHIVEDVRTESAREVGIEVGGSFNIVRNNFVFNTGNGASAQAFGIKVKNGRGQSVTGNVISGVTETNLARGIFANNTQGSLIEGNEIHDVEANVDNGITSSGATRLLVIGNRVINNTPGAAGINLPGTDNACVDNMIGNFAQPVVNCLSNGNRDY